MAFTEDMSLFFAEFGVEAVFGAATATVLLDKPDAEIFDGAAIANDPVITYATTDLTGLAHGSAITVDGASFKVREVNLVDDGKLTRARLAAA